MFTSTNSLMTSAGTVAKKIKKKKGVAREKLINLLNILSKLKSRNCGKNLSNSLILCTVINLLPLITLLFTVQELIISVVVAKLKVENSISYLPL